MHWVCNTLRILQTFIAQDHIMPSEFSKDLAWLNLSGNSLIEPFATMMLGFVSKAHVLVTQNDERESKF